MKILLVNPPPFHSAKISTRKLIDLGAPFPSLGILYLAGVIRKNPRWEVRVMDVFDFSKSIDEIRPVLRSYRPDVLGISTNTWVWSDATAMIKAAKEEFPEIHVCMGGFHLNIFPEETIANPWVDSIVIGEGEIAFRQILERLEDRQSLIGIPGVWFKEGGEIRRNDFQERISNLDVIPFPARELLPPNRNFSFSTDPNSKATTMVSSRGCPFHCIFCSTSGKYIMRSVENVLEEFIEVRRQGYQAVNFVDGTFNVSLSRTKELADAIARANLGISWAFRGRVDRIDEELAEKLRRAGCRRVNLGTEAGTDRILELAGKQMTVADSRKAIGVLKKAGITTVGYFILGYPTETDEEMDQTIRFAIESGLDFAQFNTLMVFPQTTLFNMAVEQGLVDKEYFRNWVRRPERPLELPLWTAGRTRKELTRRLRRAFWRFYLRPSYIWARLREVHSFNEFFKKAYMALHVLHPTRNE